MFAKGWGRPHHRIQAAPRRTDCSHATGSAVPGPDGKRASDPKAAHVGDTKVLLNTGLRAVPQSSQRCCYRNRLRASFWVAGGGWEKEQRGSLDAGVFETDNQQGPTLL